MKLFFLFFVAVVFLACLGCGEQGIITQDSMRTESFDMALSQSHGNLDIVMSIPDWAMEKLLSAQRDRAQLAPSSNDGSKVFSAPSEEEAMSAAAAGGSETYVYVIIASGGHEHQWFYLEIDSSSNTATGTARVTPGTAILQAFYAENREELYRSEKETMEIEGGVHYIVSLTMKRITDYGKLDITVDWDDTEVFTSQVEVEL